MEDGELPARPALLVTDRRKADPRWFMTERLLELADKIAPLGRGQCWNSKRLSIALRKIGATAKKSNLDERGWQFPSLTEARAAWCASYFARSWSSDAHDW